MTQHSLDLTAQYPIRSQNLALNVSQSTPVAIADPKLQRIQQSVDTMFPVQISISAEAKAKLAQAQES